MRNIELITTGGTIEKTYDERSGELTNRKSIVARMLSRLRLEDTRVHIRELMSKDSLLLTDDDRDVIVRAVRSACDLSDGIIILHGTDTLEKTGEELHAELGPELQRLKRAVVLTGAMRPYEMKRSDALQNLTEAILATQLVPPGVWCVAHGRVLQFPGVVKNRETGTFEKAAP
ncbi:MAG: asparaginase [Phycisphaerales bacterium]|nr:asparaginase [Phycisphaerales bacterium]